MWSYSNSLTLQFFSMLKIMGMEPRHQCGSAAIYTLIMWCTTTAAENILENSIKCNIIIKVIMLQSVILISVITFV